MAKRLAWGLPALLVAALAVPLLVELRIPLDFLRPQAERAIRETSGLLLRLQGPVVLVTGMRPGIELHEVSLAVPSQGAPDAFLRVGAARAEIALAALFERQLRVTRTSASDVVLHIDASVLEGLAATGRRQAPPGAARADPGRSGLRFVGAEVVDVTRARITFALPALTRMPRVDVDTLTLHAAADEPLTFDASGSFAGEKMTFRYETVSLSKLRAGDRAIPMQATMSIADASLAVSGSFDLESGRGDYRIASKGTGRFLERLLPGFQSALGEVKAISAEGRLRTARAETSLEALELVAGRTRVQGELRQREVNGRLRLEGRLDFEELDLRPWLPLLDKPEQSGASSEDPLDTLRSVQRTADIAFDLKVGRLIWPQREAQDVVASLTLDSKALSLRASARLLEGALEANLGIETAQTQARLKLQAQGRKIVLDALHPAVEQAGVSGAAGEAKLALRAAGATTAQLKRSLEGELDLRAVNARWRRDREGPATDIQVERAQLDATHEALRGNVRAALDDATIVLKIESKRAALERDLRLIESSFELSMRRARQRGMQLAARGALRLDPERWSVEVRDARLGKSRGQLSAKGAWEKDAPLALSASLTHFDAAALEFFQFESVKRRTKAPPWEETPVLPAGLALPAADFELRATRFQTAALHFDNLRVAGRSRGGRLERTEFELKARGGVLKGDLSADLRGKLPQLQASIAGTGFDLRPLAKRFDVTLERAIAKRLDAKLGLRGARLKEVLAQSTLEISAQDFDLVMPGPVDARRRLAFLGSLEAASSNGALRIAADGKLNGKAFRATSRGPQFASLFERAGPVALDIDLSLADSALAVHGTVAEGPVAELELRLESKRIEDLLALGGLTAQARGALTASAQLKLTRPARYAFENLDLRLGENALAGRVVFDGSAARRSVDARLAGPLLRLRDLGFGANGTTTKQWRVPKDASWLEPLRRYDAGVTLKVEQLYEDDELIGSADAALKLAAGRLELERLHIRNGDSELRLSGEIDAASATPLYEMHAQLQHYDLTALLHVFDPDAPGTAMLDARAALRSSGVGDAVITNLSGQFDAAGYGRNVGSGAVQMMGLNPLQLALGLLDSSRGSKINCVVGVFDIEKGIARSRALFADTTRLRIMGNLDVNLGARTLDGGLRPHPKRPTLFNVSTPVSLSGSIDDPKVSLATSALPELVIRYSNPYTMFVGALMDTQSANADGSDDCRAAYAKAEAARPELGEALRREFRFLPPLGG